MKNAEQIKNALDVLRESDGLAEAPPFLETRLRAAFREQHAPRRSKWWAQRRLWAGVAMAGMVAGAVFYRAAAPDVVEAPVPVAAKAPAPRPEQKPVIASVVQQPASKRAKPVPAAARRREPVPAVTARAVETEEFMAIPYAPPITAQDRGEIIRVGVSRQSLRRMGIPVNPERLFERVPADVLVGEDGIPRGIRLIRASEGR